MIKVVELVAAQEAAYSDFLLANQRTMIYGSLQFRDFLQQAVSGTPRYFVALSGSQIVGALPCFSARDAAGRVVINSLPWYGSHGGCLMLPDAGSEVRIALLQAYREAALSAEVAFATLILPPHESASLDEYRAALLPDATDGRIGQISDLPEDGPGLETRLESLLAQKTRNLVRKACRQGFALDTDDSDEAWEFLHRTHLENMTQIGGQAKPWGHFVAMRATIPQAWRRLSIARLDGQPVAALLLLRFNRTVEYITPAIQHEFRSLQPLSFLIWHAMLEAVRDGYRWWNWGGTWATQHSLHHFKAGWGARDYPYQYLIHAKPDALDALRQNRQSVANAFPYFFTYPYHLLE